ncbi:MAG: hypothetical protein R2762_26110 [Bryobacteraceae bacterium]
MRTDPLLQLNRYWLSQALDLLLRIDDRQYRDAPGPRCPHRIGPQMRHIIEFYECFLDGLARGSIDYDARARNRDVEIRRLAGVAAIENLLARLDASALYPSDSPLQVRLEDTEGLGLPECNAYVASSARREWMALSSHTVHHFALVAVALDAWGIPADPGFGVAPSTLAWRARQPAASEAA